MINAVYLFNYLKMKDLVMTVQRNIFSLTTGLLLLLLAGCQSSSQQAATSAPLPAASHKKHSIKPLSAKSVHATHTAPLKQTDIPHKTAQEQPPPPQKTYGLPDGLYAKLATGKGDIFIKLFYQKAPLTVANFVGLAEGSKYSIRRGNPYYNNCPFFEVVRRFGLKTGDPTGTGKGGPGYTFPSEFHPELSHDSIGMVSMINAGPNKNGSQFFITLKPTPWLDNQSPVFGKVVKGLGVLPQIRKGDRIKTVEILRIGENVKKYKVTDAFFGRLLRDKYKKDNKPFPTQLKGRNQIYQSW